MNTNDSLLSERDFVNQARLHAAGQGNRAMTFTRISKSLETVDASNTRVEQLQNLPPGNNNQYPNLS